MRETALIVHRPQSFIPEHKLVIEMAMWVHSSVVRAADCRSAGPWFKSGCALLAAIAAAQARAVALEHQEHHQQQRFIFFIFCSYCSVVNVSYVVCVFRIATF